MSTADSRRLPRTESTAVTLSNPRVEGFAVTAD